MVSLLLLITTRAAWSVLLLQQLLMRQPVVAQAAPDVVRTSVFDLVHTTASDRLIRSVDVPALTTGLHVTVTQTAGPSVAWFNVCLFHARLPHASDCWGSDLFRRSTRSDDDVLAMPVILNDQDPSPGVWFIVVVPSRVSLATTHTSLRRQLDESRDIERSLAIQQPWGGNVYDTSHDVSFRLRIDVVQSGTGSREIVPTRRPSQRARRQHGDDGTIMNWTQARTMTETLHQLSVPAARTQLAWHSALVQVLADDVPDHCQVRCSARMYTHPQRNSVWYQGRACEPITLAPGVADVYLRVLMRCANDTVAWDLVPDAVDILLEPAQPVREITVPDTQWSHQPGILASWSVDLHAEQAAAIDLSAIHAVELHVAVIASKQEAQDNDGDDSDDGDEGNDGDEDGLRGDPVARLTVEHPGSAYTRRSKLSGVGSQLAVPGPRQGIHLVYADTAVSLLITASSCPARGSCSNTGTCVITQEPVTGTRAGACRCSSSALGWNCGVVTDVGVTHTNVLATAMVLSNLSMAPALIALLARGNQRYLTCATALLLTALTSSAYHACRLGVCILKLERQQWTRLDAQVSTASFYFVAIHMADLPIEWRSPLQLLALLLAVVYSNTFLTTLPGFLTFMLIASCLVAARAWRHARVLPNLSWRWLTIGFLGLISVSMVLASPVEDDEKHPWWHFTIMVTACCMILAKREDPSGTWYTNHTNLQTLNKRVYQPVTALVRRLSQTSSSSRSPMQHDQPMLSPGTSVA